MHVQQDEVTLWITPQAIQRLSAIGGRENRIAGNAQELAYRISVRAVILHD